MNSFARQIAPSLLCALLSAAAPGCHGEVLVGEQEVVPPADGDLDADQETSPDADDASAEADVEGEAPLSCVQALTCVTACGEDALCAIDCGERVCPSAEEAFIDLRDCALPACGAECADFGSARCQSCVGDLCPLAAFACLGADCQG